MRTVFAALSLFGALYCLLTIPALAAPIPINEVDKFTVDLPAGAVTGSLVLCDGNVGADKKSCVDNKLSDVVVFLGTVNGVAVNKATMFSDKEAGEGNKPDNPNADLADLMSAILNPSTFRPEMVNEGKKEDTPYAPGAGDPGFVNKDVTYTVTSDQPVPEPSSILLLGSGLGGALAFALYRRQGRFHLTQRDH